VTSGLPPVGWIYSCTEQNVDQWTALRRPAAV
jgi:hypothetical protein